MKITLDFISETSKVSDMNCNATFLNNLMVESLVLFEYYRHGPVQMHKLKPGFIFQACVDLVLDKHGITFVESGLGDHCLPDLSVALQLKTTIGMWPESDRFIFCRSEALGENLIQARCDDVENRILDMYGATGTSRFILSYVNLTTKGVEHYLLHEGNQLVGDWLKPENVTCNCRQTHFRVLFSKMTKLQ